MQPVRLSLLTPVVALDIRRTGGIEGDERQDPVIKQLEVGCFATKRTVLTLLPSSHRLNQWGRLQRQWER